MLPQIIKGITTTHHDKSEGPKLSVRDEDAPKEKNATESNERQRRLIPYMTFYLANNYNQPQQQHQQHQQHQQQQQLQQPRYQFVPQKVRVQPIYHNKYIIANYEPKYTEPPPRIIVRTKQQYTPFLESNKLPGHFTPMLRNPIIQQVNTQQYQPQVVNEPNFSTIFDKLLHLKQLQNKLPQYTPVPQYQTPKLNIAAQYYTNDYGTIRPPTKYIPVDDYQQEDEEQNYKPEPVYHKPEPVYHKPELSYKPEPAYKPIPSHVKTIIHTYTPANIEIPHGNKNEQYDNFESLKVYNQITPHKVPVKNVQIISTPENNYKQIVVIPEKTLPVPEKNYETYILRPVQKPEPNNKPFQPIYHPIQLGNLPKLIPKVTTPLPIYQPTENPNSLSVILKQLQDSNTLPHTLTPDNIDNSIKTLVHILNTLKNTKLQRPIIVDDVSEEDKVQDEEENDEDNSTVGLSDHYALNTPEGGTPGKPGEDYPAYSKIPQTSFNCKTQRYKGFFGDPDTNCQV